MADTRLDEASSDVVKSIREANQIVAKTLVTVLDRNLKLAQSTFLSGGEVLEKETNDMSNLAQVERQPLQRQQDAFQRLTSGLMDLSRNGLRIIPFWSKPGGCWRGCSTEVKKATRVMGSLCYQAHARAKACMTDDRVVDKTQERRSPSVSKQALPLQTLGLLAGIVVATSGTTRFAGVGKEAAQRNWHHLFPHA